MKKYIALLRGINVGGKNKVSMTELKILFETIGFINVTTYINSGNVIFFSNIDNEEKIRNLSENALMAKYEYIIPIVIISAIKLKVALDNVPPWWNNDKKSKHNTIFIIPPFTAKEIIEQIGDIKQEYEKIYCYENIIFWSAPIKTFSKTRLTKFVGENSYKNITIRNANTTRKLLQII